MTPLESKYPLLLCSLFLLGVGPSGLPAHPTSEMPFPPGVSPCFGSNHPDSQRGIGTFDISSGPSLVLVVRPRTSLGSC